MRGSGRSGGVPSALRFVAAGLAGLCLAGPVAAKDLTDIVTRKSITLDQGFRTPLDAPLTF